MCRAVSKTLPTEPEYSELLEMKPGPELDRLTSDTIFPEGPGLLIEFPKYSQNIEDVFRVVKKMGYISLITDEGILSVSCRFLMGSGYGRQVCGYLTIPEAICKAAIVAKKFSLEQK